VRLLLLLTLLLVIGSPALAQKCARGSLVAEVTYVRDGDTIEVGGLPIRLQGLAAPEGNEPGGDEATQAMQALVYGRELRCDLDGQRTYDRCVGICYLEGQDISEVMVRRGLARDCPDSAGAGTPRPSMKLLPMAPPSAGPTPCRGTAREADQVRDVRFQSIRGSARPHQLQRPHGLGSHRRARAPIRRAPRRS
jgi:micrococcal nuclease